MRRSAHLGALVASATLAVTGLTTIAPAAQAISPKDPIGVDTGATWLTKQLTHGIVHNTEFNFDDYGLTVDIGLGLNAVGGHASTVSGIATALAPGAHDNYYTSTFNGVTTTYAGSVAKLAMFVQRSGGDPTSYGGHDLIALLEGRVHAGTPIDGRIEDANNGFGDANVLGQAYAVAALHTAGSSKESSALSFLLDQQCPHGGFRLNFNTDKTASSQSCADDNQAQIDATSVALLELKTLPASSPVTTAITDATAFLVGKQQSSGAWGGDPGGSAANANATGLAAWALGNTVESAQGAAWLREHQATYYDYCTRLKNDVGTVAYDDAGLAGGRSSGIDSSSQDEFRRAAAQALPGLQYLDADSTPAAPQLTGPSGFAKGGATATFRTTGVHTGDQLCLTGGPGGAGGTASGTTWTRAARLADLTGTRTFTVRDRDGHSDSVAVRQLGSKTLKVTKSHYRNKRSASVTATIYGLVAGERASLFYKGSLVRAGVADTAGHFQATFSAGRALGKRTIAGYGQFGDIRKGYTKIKVVR